MEDKMIPYFVHEGDMSRLERTIKRLWVLCILLVIMLVATNGAWIWYQAQFEVVETTTQEVSQDVDTGTGDATVVGIRDIYGKSETESQDYNN